MNMTSDRIADRIISGLIQLHDLKFFHRITFVSSFAKVTIAREVLFIFLSFIFALENLSRPTNELLDDTSTAPAYTTPTNATRSTSNFEVVSLNEVSRSYIGKGIHEYYVF